MLKYARTLLVWCCVTLVLTIAAWGATYSPSYRKCVSDHANHKGGDKGSNLNESIASGSGVEVLPVFLLCEGAFIDENNGTITALATLAIAAFALTLWRATTGMLNAAGEQSGAMERSIAESAKSAAAIEDVAKSMSRNTELIGDTVAANKVIAERQRVFGQMQMRAYLTILVGSFYEQDFGKNASLQIHPTILNTGNTPAHEVSYRGCIVVRPFPPGPDFDLTMPPLPEEGSRITIGPHQTTSMPFNADRWYSDEEIAEIKLARDSRVYIYGTVNYIDVFGYPHFTNFCYSTVWSVQGAPMGIWTRRHNDCD
jgi:hypothetical protein